MSAADYLKDAFLALGHLLYGVVGWTLIAPLAKLVPKRRDWIAVIGREDGKFLDNTKYFFIETSLESSFDLRVVHVTERRDVHELVTRLGLASLMYPSLKAAWFLVRCGTVVVDSIEWCQRWRCFLLAGAKAVQLWHGVGFKRIELDKWRNEARGRGLVGSRWLFGLRMLRKRLRGRLPLYSAVVTTSSFYRDNVFSRAFRSRHVLTTGYPRNCFGQLSAEGSRMAWSNVDSVVSSNLDAWRSQGRKIVLIAPTFRDTRATPLGLDSTQQIALDEMCAEAGLEFLFKLHPYEHGTFALTGRHLHLLDPYSDAYPLFPHLHAMVTDYSSIYMDFLLLDRPVVFYTPDLEEYVARDRGIQFDLEEMTPGPKIKTWSQVALAVLNDSEHWRLRRSEMRSLAFDNAPGHGATAKLWDFLSSEGWLPLNCVRPR
jgi:hypothetical protein